MKKAYNQFYYQTIAPGSAASAEEVIPVVCSFFKPRSVVDVGCGVGTWLAVWEKQGITDYLGLDGDYIQPEQLHIHPEKFRACNLEEGVRLNRRFDLVTSLEVAEHIRPQRAANFIAFLCSLGDVILFSAAIPGQGGVMHYNEQYPEYWSEQFTAQGFTGYDCLRNRIWLNSRIDTCYRQNLFFFVRNSVKESYLSIIRHEGRLLPLVHPDHFEQKQRVIASYKKIVSTPLHAGWHFLKSFVGLLQRRQPSDW